MDFMWLGHGLNWNGNHNISINLGTSPNLGTLGTELWVVGGGWCSCRKRRRKKKKKVGYLRWKLEYVYFMSGR